jgi:hypothetical protein
MFLRVFKHFLAEYFRSFKKEGAETDRSVPLCPSYGCSQRSPVPPPYPPDSVPKGLSHAVRLTHRALSPADSDYVVGFTLILTVATCTSVVPARGPPWVARFAPVRVAHTCTEVDPALTIAGSRLHE